MKVSMVHASSAIFTVKTAPDLVKNVLKGASIQNKKLVINNLDALKSSLPTLAANVADFGDKSAPEPVKALSAWIINETAQQLGVKLNSPHGLYTAIAEGKISKKFAVPAINIRGNSLNTAQAMFAAAIEQNVGALIVEIARSEIGYTNQDPREFASVIQAAAILEGWKGPLFLQGDHIQLSADKVKKGGDDAAKEKAAHSALIKKLLENGFGSIDLDMSPLERRNEPELSFDEQQQENYKLTAAKVVEVRRLQEQLGLPYTVMLGGETGEVGKTNTRKEDIEAYARGLIKELNLSQDAMGMLLQGISKIAVQTGTSHGGVTLPDGTVAKVKIDFGVLKMAREAGLPFGWTGPVQHGASTLPEEAFSQFVENGAAEVHLATGFQDILYDLGIFTVPELQAKIDRYLVDKFIGEWKPGKTFAQFARDTRKKTNGPFKFDIWTLPEEVRIAVSKALKNKFAFLFGALGVTDTKDIVSQFVPEVGFHLPYPEVETVAAVEGVKTDEGGKDLAD